MQLLTTIHIWLLDASVPKVNGFYLGVHVPPGSYVLEEIPNPNEKPPALDPAYWSATWIVIQGTKHGMSRNAWQHEYVYHHNPSVLVTI